MSEPGRPGAGGPDGDARDVTRRVKAFYERYPFPRVRPPEQDGLTPATPTPRPAARFVTAIAPQRRVTDALAAREDETQPSRFLDLYLPVGLLVVGSVLGTTLCPRFVAKTVQPLPYILISLGLQTLVFLPVAFLAAVVTARLLDVSFGPLGTVALKLVAVTHGSGALADGTFFAMTVLMGNDWHTPLVGFVPYLIACGLPLALLFGLSVGETALMVGIMYLARFLTVLLLGMTVPHLFG